MPSLKLDPQEFFTKTASYASQSRGMFRLTTSPEVLKSDESKSKSPMSKSPIGVGLELLRSGILAKSIQMPGSSLSTFEEYSLSGPTRKVAHGVTYGPLTVEFYLMGKDIAEARALYATLHLWHNKIIGGFSNDNVPKSDTRFFALEYFNDYIVDAEIAIFSPTETLAEPNSERAVIHTKYYEVYPQLIQGLTPSWDSPDAPLTLSVNFECVYASSQF